MGLPPNEEPNRKQFERAQRALYRSMRTFEIFAMESGVAPSMVEHFTDLVRRGRRK